MSDELGLPDELKKHYDKARGHYLAAKYHDSLGENRKLFDLSREREHVLGQILGLRFQGLCWYRLSDFQKSIQTLQQAQQRAQEAGAEEQELLILNHLGAAVRADGQLKAADDIFDKAIARADEHQHHIAHGRLLANRGALYDQRGERQEADHCYDRYERLIEAHGGNKHQLANARALTGRSALLKGDWERAKKKFSEELELALELGDKRREISARLHKAKMDLATGDIDGARSGSRDALALARDLGDPKRLCDALEEQGEFLRRQGDLRGAYEHLKKSEVVGAKMSEKQLNFNTQMVLLCVDARLHGEALHYVREAWKIYEEIFKPVREWWPNAGAHLLGELRERMRLLLADETLDKRNDDFEAQLQEVAANLSLNGTRNLNERKARDVIPYANMQATEIWPRLLGQHHYEELTNESKEKIGRAELDYTAVFNRLDSCATDLAWVVEQELLKRLNFRGAPGMNGRPRTLGTMVRAVSDHVRQCRGCQQHVHLEKIALSEHLSTLLGDPVSLVEIRNKVLHPSVVSINLYTIDAIKRALTLDPGVLPAILSIPPGFRLFPVNRGQA